MEAKDAKEQAMEVAGKFARYLKTKDEKVRDGISIEEIEFSLSHMARDKDRPFYDVMERQYNKLKERKREIISEKERKKERKHGFWQGLITGIVSTVVGGIVLALILKYFSLN